MDFSNFLTKRKVSYPYGGPGGGAPWRNFAFFVGKSAHVPVWAVSRRLGGAAARPRRGSAAQRRAAWRRRGGATAKRCDGATVGFRCGASARRRRVAGAQRRSGCSGTTAGRLGGVTAWQRRGAAARWRGAKAALIRRQDGDEWGRRSLLKIHVSQAHTCHFALVPRAGVHSFMLKYQRPFEISVVLWTFVFF